MVMFLQITVGAFLLSSLLSLFLAVKDYERNINLSFCLLTLALAVNTWSTLIRAGCQIPAEWILFEKFQNTILFIIAIATILFISFLTNNYSRKVFIYHLSILAVFYIINLVNPYGIGYSKLTFVHPGHLNEPGGVLAEASLWNWPLMAYIVFLIVYFVKLLRAFYKKDGKKNAVFLMVTLSIILLLCLVDLVVINYQLIPSGYYFSETGFLLFIFIGFKRNFESVIKSGEIKTELLQNEQRYRHLFENSPVGIYRTTPEGKILMANPMILKLLGHSSFEELSRKELSGQGNYKNHARQYFIDKIERDNAFLEETTWVGKNKEEIYIRENALAVRDADNKVVYYEGTIEDITDRKKIEKELICAKEKAEESDRLKTEFLAQMSHEIRTPINTILNFTNLMYEEFQSGSAEEISNFYKIIVVAGKRIIRTIDLLLNMSEIQTGAYTPNCQEMDLNELLDGLAKDFQIAARSKGLHLGVENPENRAIVRADEYSVGQLFINLIDNAIKFTDKGSVKVRLRQDNSHKIVEIEDSGAGISEEYMENIFKAFTQEEQGYTRRYEGNGLGLALVKKYCELNKADISVRSKKGEGSVFTVTFDSLPPAAMQ